MTDTAVAPVQTPKQAKVASDAASRAADKAAADAQVAEDQAAFDAAKAAQATAHDVAVKAEADAFAALSAASDIQVPPAADPTDDAAVAARNAILASNGNLVSEAVRLDQAAKDAQAALDKANAAVVAAKDKLVASSFIAAGLTATNENSPWYYCLEHTHTGDIKSSSRFFQSDETGCPVCPQCKRQVSAAQADGFGIYPPGILAVADRLAGGRS